MEAAEHWAWLQHNDPTEKDDELERLKAQMAEWNAPQSAIDAVVISYQNEKDDIEQDVVIWLENQITVNIFFGLSTQWHVQPMTGQRIGLNRTALEIEIRNNLELVNADAMKRAEIYQDVTAMEHAAVAQLRRQEQRKQEKTTQNRE